jgi:hypothetical protein
VLFWGIDPPSLGASVLHPTGALLMVLAAGGLLRFRRSLGVAAVVFAVVEAASVVWWGLFTAQRGASGFAVAIAVLLWVLPAVGAVLVVGAKSRRGKEPAPTLDAVGGRQGDARDTTEQETVDS